MEKDMEILMKCSLLEGLSPEGVEKALLCRGIRRAVPKGHFLIQYQEMADYFGVILSGSVQTMHIFSDGSVSIMDVLRTGEVYGADLVCTKSRISPYYAVAAEDTELLLFPSAILLGEGLIPEDVRREMRDRLLVLLAQSNMKKEYRLAILSRKGLRERITTYLSMQAAKRHVSTFRIPFNREELASYLCVNRSALSHELSVMKKEGLLNFRKNEFTLLEKETGKGS